MKIEFLAKWFWLLALIPLFLMFRSCTSPKGHIEAVLREDDRVSQETIGSVVSDATPATYANAIGRYCTHMEGYSMSDCPADFKTAYKQHVRAWRAMQGAVSQIPNSFWEGVLAGALNSLLKGELDGGASRMGAAVDQAYSQVEVTWNKVEEVAAKYGASSD